MTFRTIWSRSEAVLEIRRSRFIGRAAPVETPEQAQAFIAEIAAAERQANHHCSCYRIGEEGLVQRYSDDGEPQGTAGVPMLELLRKEDVTNCAVVVTRYFGGVKLGVPGLIRAYTQLCQMALHEAKIIRRSPYFMVKLLVPYPLLGKVDHFLSAHQIHELRRNFEEMVLLWVAVEAEKTHDFEQRIAELSSASVVTSREAKRLIAVEGGGTLLDAADQFYSGKSGK